MDNSNLEEHNLKNDIEISRCNMSCDDIICKTIPPPLQGSKHSYFRMGVVGRSGSGKSNFVKNITEKKSLYGKKFSNVFIVSPSIHTQKIPRLPEDRFYTSLSDLPTIVNRINTEEDMEGRSLIIIDDCLSELKQGGESMDIVKKLYYNNRHMGRPILDDDDNQIESGAISTIITAQKFSALPRYIRSQITCWSIFEPSVKSELNTIYDELIAVDKPVFNEILRRTYKKPYNFLFIDANDSSIYNNFKSKFIVNNKQYL